MNSKKAMLDENFQQIEQEIENEEEMEREGYYIGVQLQESQGTDCFVADSSSPSVSD
jgi:hypothetical protein